MRGRALSGPGTASPSGGVFAPDPEFAGHRRCAGLTPPTLELPAHSAPLGLAFYIGRAFPPAYRGTLFVALHGSRPGLPTEGYKVIRVTFAGVLRNAIDWASRPPNVLAGKVAASFGASPGAQGTARSQMNLRLCLSAVQVWILPRTVLVAHAREAFDGEALRDPRQAEALVALGRAPVAAVQSGVGAVR